MAETPSTQAERHCASCGAVLYEGAAWCGMCFEPVAPERDATLAAEPETALPVTPQAAPPAEPPIGTEKPERPADPAPVVSTTDVAAEPMWPCPVCESRNPIELDFCATCGASFASLMRQETTVVNVDSHAVFRRSLIFVNACWRSSGWIASAHEWGFAYRLSHVRPQICSYAGLT